MRVGMIFECGPSGADKAVCEYLARRLDPEIEIFSVTLTNKPLLITECGKATASLLAQGCERVVIIWDLYPAWREDGQNPCRHEDKENIRQSLRDAGVTSSNVYLVCIHEEMEAWLLADERALITLLSKPTRRVLIRRKSRTEQISNPKKELSRLFKQHSGRPYIDYQDAIRIVRKMEDLNRLKKCETFARFALKVAGVSL